MAHHLFTSESVTEGHPDKICDQVSDAILDAILAQDPNGRVACECTVTTGVVNVMGEITTDCYVDIPKVVRQTVREIGYDRAKYGFDCETCAVITNIDEQSGDIAMGVNRSLEVKEGAGDADDQIAAKMAQLTGCVRYRPDDMILEGGSITVDGEGTLVVTDQCLLSPGRTCSAVLEEEEDPESIWPKYHKKFEPWSEELRAYMDEHLKDYLGVEKVIWVKEGIDPEETNGHIDDVATFIAPGVMACIWTDDPEYPFYEQCHAAYETLSNAVDAKGRKMKVYKLCMPVNPLFMDQASCDTIDADENAEPRVPDEPLIASYMNYLVTNGGVIVPRYGDENDVLAVQTLQEIYDEVWGEGVYKCVGVQSEQVVFGGGNIHCITQQEPSA